MDPIDSCSHRRDDDPHCHGCGTHTQSSRTCLLHGTGTSGLRGGSEVLGRCRGSGYESQNGKRVGGLISAHPVRPDVYGGQEDTLQKTRPFDGVVVTDEEALPVMGVDVVDESLTTGSSLTPVPASTSRSQT